jgi:hypothetical protein
MASTAADIVQGGLLNINSYSPGEPLSTYDASVGLNALNDLLDSLSNDEAFVFTQVENIFPWVGNQYQYSVGNPIGGTFYGTVTSGSPIISGIASLPANLAVGATLTDLGAAIPIGTALAPVPTLVSSIGSTNLIMSANALLTPANPDQITYTVPGNIPMNRPLRFRSGFTRTSTSGIANLDYTLEFTDFDNYKRELLKNVQGPWPYIAAYQPTFPYGTLYVYPAPAANYTAHLFSDLIITEYATINTAYSLPQGYTRALKKLLGLELAPIYGKTPSAELRMQAKEAKMLIQGTNSTPVKIMQFDTAICRSSTKDASWAQDGGFR